MEQQPPAAAPVSLPRMRTALLHTLAWIVGASWFAAVAAARPESVFDVPGEKTSELRAYVTVRDELPTGAQGPTSRMLLLLDGVLAQLSPREIALLVSTPEPAGRLIDARGDLERIGVVHLVGRRGQASVEVMVRPDGTMIARELSNGGKKLAPEQQRIVRLNHRRFEEASGDWLLFQGFAGPGLKAAAPDGAPPAERPTADLPLAQVVDLPRPYTPGRSIMDPQTLGDRFQHGRKSNLSSKRALSEEKLYVRLPQGYDPRHPAGLLVWVNADTGGEPPKVFHAVADELGIICVGAANSGNLREVSERYQLVFDGVATVCKRYHVDPRRVYITGVSGGGRVSSMLCACFPDVLTGAVPIVGLSCYDRVPLGNSRYARPGYEKPVGRFWTLLKTRRMAPMSGPPDANFPEIKGATDVMNKDGLHIRLFEYPDMGHQMPTAERFAEAIKWVDEPYREQTKKESDLATSLLSAYVSRYGNVPPADDKQRAALVKVTDTGPWTEAAWKAVELLKHPGGK